MQSNKIIRDVITLTLLTSCPFFVSAQSTSKLLECGVDELNDVPFKVQLNGQSAKLHLKGYAHKLRYVSSFVSKSGDRWSVYKNAEIYFHTTHPQDNYFDVRTVSSKAVIATGNCN